MNALMNVSKNGNYRDSGLSHKGWSNWIDDLFNIDTFPSVLSTHTTNGVTLPKVNVRETKDNYFLDLAVPGLKKENFNINLENDTLTISAEHNTENESKDENYTRKEFSYSSFKRTFTLPELVDEANIRAKYEDGVLTVQLPKREEAKQSPSRTIDIS